MYSKFMTTLIYLTVLSGLLGQLVKLPLGSGNFYPLDIFVFLTVSVWVFTKIIIRNYQSKIPKYFILLFFFLLWVLISLILGKSQVLPSEFLIGFAYFLRFLFYSLFSLVVHDQKKNSNKFSKILIFSSLILATAGFIQLIVYSDLAKLAAQFGYDPHKNRLVSTFLDPNFTAAYLVLGLSLVLSISNSVQGNLKKWYGLVGAVLFVALIFTFSRSGWVMFSAVLFLYGVLRSPKLLAVAFLAATFAYFAVPRVQTRISGLTDPDDSARLRLISWSNALTIFKNTPVFGVGYNLYRPAQERYGFFDYRDLEGGHAGAGSDSSFLLILATTGTVGFILLSLLYGNLFIFSLRNTANPVGLALVLSLFGLFFNSQFINSLFFPQIILWLWILVGLV